MSKKHISEVMQPPHSISFSANVEEAVREMSSIETDALLIRQNEEYSGIFTKTDLIKLLEKKYQPCRGHCFHYYVKTYSHSRYGYNRERSTAKNVG